MPYDLKSQAQALSINTPVFRSASANCHVASIADSVANGLEARRLETVTDLMSGWVWETDPEHRFTYMSDGVERFTGRPASWHYGRTREELGNDCGPEHWDAFIRTLEARQPFSAVEFTRWDGNEQIHMRTAGQPYYDDGQFRGYRGLAFRISEEVQERRLRHKAETEKLRLLASLEMVVAHYPYAIVVFDPELRLLFANDIYYEELGIQQRELPVGISFAELFNLLITRGEFRGGNPDDLLQEQLELTRSGRSYAFERSRPNGQVLMAHGFALPCGGYVRTFMDVTDRADARWTISALQARLR